MMTLITSSITFHRVEQVQYLTSEHDNDIDAIEHTHPLCTKRLGGDMITYVACHT